MTASKQNSSNARRAAEAEQWFRERIKELGAIVVEPEWRGVNKPHRVICAAGHECAPHPSYLRSGGGICGTCANLQRPRSAASLAAERRFRQQITERGGIVVEPEWLGTGIPHRVICAEGHECAPTPGNVARRGGFCPTCRTKAAASLAYHRTRSTSSWDRFRKRVAELGGAVTEPRWLGNGKPHRVICAAGHERSVIPSGVLKGNGLCRTCAGLDPADSEQAFRERVEALGARVVEPVWLGVHQPHRVVCAAGHECTPYPGRVRDGGGLCRICARSSSDALYVVENESLQIVKVGITTGVGTVRLREHHRDGFTVVLRYLQELDDAAFLEAHTLRTLKAAGIQPIRGLEYFDRAPALPVVLDLVDNWI